jgi:xylose isomerase
VEYKKKIGFTGTFLIEPKPHEPTSHQYDFDCATALAFLRGYGLDKEFKLNVETNHATLAKHTMVHELMYASIHGMLGSIDANRGDLLLGWDTDQFPTDLYLTTQIMLIVLNQNGLGSGGLNFDAKVRRESFEPVDLFHAHIGGMDAFAQGLKIAAAIRKDGVFADFIKQRYASWDSGIGAQIEKGQVTFEDLEAYMLQKGDAAPNVSGRQEMLENIFNRYFR